jgi:hypothetical protein
LTGVGRSRNDQSCGPRAKGSVRTHGDTILAKMDRLSFRLHDFVLMLLDLVAGYASGLPTNLRASHVRSKESGPAVAQSDEELAVAALDAVLKHILGGPYPIASRVRLEAYSCRAQTAVDRFSAV